MMRRLIAGAAVLAAAGAAVTGCGTQETDPPGLAWASNVCSYVGKGASNLRMPQVDTSRPQVARDGIVMFLKTLSAQLDTLTVNLRAQGAPPVDGGKATYDSTMRTLTANKNALESTTTRLEQAKVTDAASLRKALTDAGNGVRKLVDYKGPAQDFRTNPALDKAFGQSPTCRSQGIDDAGAAAG